MTNKLMSLSPVPPLRILVAARYPSVRAGLRAMLDAHAELTVVGEVAGFGSETEFDPGAADVLVADLDDDVDTRWFGNITHSIPVVLLAGDPLAFRELVSEEPRPRAYLLKGATAEEMAAAVVAVAQGLVVMDPAVARSLIGAPGTVAADPRAAAISPLTEREQDVLQLVASGLPNKAIALRLGISEHTVKFHVGSILGKLGAASRTEAVTLAVRTGLLPL